MSDRHGFAGVQPTGEDGIVVVWCLCRWATSSDLDDALDYLEAHIEHAEHRLHRE